MKTKLVTAFVALFAAACSSASAPAAGTGASTGTGGGGSGALLAAPPAGQGVQYEMVSSLAPGQEIERVKFFQVPPEGLYVNREELRYTPGSHHILVYTTPYTSIPTTDIHGNTVDTSGIIDAPNGGTADWNITGVIAGAQSAGAPPVVSGLPSNVAIKLPGNTVILMNTHSLNTTDSTLTVDARVNLWTVPAQQVTVEAGILFYYDPIIRVPGNASSYAEMACPVTSDITLVNLQTHMHARGLGGQAFVTPPGGATPQSIYTSSSWQNVYVESFAPAMQIAQGSTLDYHCNYENPGPNTILQGLSTKDEMCMIIGVYYPKDPKTELCSPDGTFANVSMAGTWSGKGGTAGCQASLECIAGATTDDATYGCILGACPAIAKPFNDTFKCMGAQQGACKTQCAGSATASCTTTCLEQACSTELSTCLAATCG
jgi:hypothetical protein